jgi:hypothetical protein
MPGSRINLGQLVREAAAVGAATRADRLRTRERAELKAALDSDVVRRAAESDPRLKQQLASAALAFRELEEQSVEADRRLTVAVDALVAQLGKLMELSGRLG